MASITLVTGIVDIGRERLPASFARPFSFYRESIGALLALDLPIVVYADRNLDLATSKDFGCRIVGTDLAALERFPYFDDVQRIRKREQWRRGAPWLSESPQALLPHYNPLVMSKLFWLAEQARENPFRTRYFVWIDGGVTRTVPFKLLKQSLHSSSLPGWLERFLFLCYPYSASGEVHGFDHRALANYATVPAIEWVARGGFFGGSGNFVIEAARLYDAILGHTLSRGHMGTEESVFTILANLHPGIFDRFFVGADGLIAKFFADVADGRAAS